MRKRAGNAARWLVVTFSVIALTSFTVDATLNGGGVSQSALGILATSLTSENEASSVCPRGMVPITGGTTATCIDMYEVSPGEHCPIAEPTNVTDSQSNVTSGSCAPASTPEAVPWRHVTREQAALACAKAGKRLPTNMEWHSAALGTPDGSIGGYLCNVEGDGVTKTGASTGCVSASGAYDMIGNVWEWVSGDVYDGMYDGRQLPPSGYISQVGSDGVAVYTSERAEELMFEDYAWTSGQGAFGMIRGGHYGNGSDAGLYALNAYTLPTTPGTAIGFRCVQ